MSPAQVLLGRSLVNLKIANTIDRKACANPTRLTLGLSPISIAMDYFDWLAHPAVSQRKQAHMTDKALRKATRLGIYSAESLWNPDTPRCIEPLPQDGSATRPGSTVATMSSTQLLEDELCA